MFNSSAFDKNIALSASSNGNCIGIAVLAGFPCEGMAIEIEAYVTCVNDDISTDIPIKNITAGSDDLIVPTSIVDNGLVKMGWFSAVTKCWRTAMSFEFAAELFWKLCTDERWTAEPKRGN